MFLPRILHNISKTRRKIGGFSGLNRTENYKEGQLRDSCGLSTENYPTLSQSKPFVKDNKYTGIVDMYEHNGKLLLVMEDGKLYYDEKLLGNVTAGKKQFATVNTKLCIFPDKVYIDLNTLELLPLAEGITSADKPNSVFMNARIIMFNNLDEAENASDMFSVGDTVDVRGTPHGLYDKSEIQILEIDKYGATFNKDTFTGAISYLELTEDLSGDKIIKVQYYITDGDDTDEPTIDIESEYYSVHIYDTVKAGKCLYFRGYGFPFIYVWDEGKLTTVGKYTATQVYAVSDADIEMLPYSFDGAKVRMCKHIPDLDYICESENRLWGVSNRKHSIYASALGKPGEFTEFDVISTDSYAVAVASEDDFTAICAYGGGVCCFKENRLHKILGSYPAEYHMNEYEITGVQKGSERSLCIINEVLYYKGERGVYAYSGGTPGLISYELGNVIYNNAVSNTDGRHYYVALDSANESELFAYDTFHKLWMKEQAMKASAIANVGDTMTILSEGTLFMQSDDTSKALWKAELVPFDSDGIKRNYGKIIVRLDMGESSSLRILIREDNKRPRKICSRSALHEMNLELPLPISHCDRLSIIFEGTGKVTLRSFTVEYLG